MSTKQKENNEIKIDIISELECPYKEWLKIRSVQKINQKYINSIVKTALNEDLKPLGDITTHLITSKNRD